MLVTKRKQSGPKTAMVRKFTAMKMTHLCPCKGDPTKMSRTHIALVSVGHTAAP